MTPRVFILGGTGYMGSRLIPRLLERGCTVTAVARPESEHRLPAGCHVVAGNALDRSTYIEHIRKGDTVVHLVGVSHPSPAKAAEFDRIDYTSAVEAIRAAQQRRAGHFVYVSVAHPAPVMRAYWSVRASCERVLKLSGLPASVLRPWYVLGPGHWWPLALAPLYFAAERIPSTREAARRLGLVTIAQMIGTLERAVMHPPAESWRVWGVDEIRGAQPATVRVAA